MKNIDAKSRFPLLSRVVEIVVLFFIFVLVEINTFIRFRQFPEVVYWSDHEGDYVRVAILTVLLMAFLLYQKGLLTAYVESWQKNKLVTLFLVYCLVSLFWTVFPPATDYKLIWLFFSSIAGAYIAVRYPLRSILNVLTWIGAVFTILSILLVAYVPFIGIMQNQLFFGSWNGIFWHRNHAGNIFAFFSVIFLLQVVLKDNSSTLRRIIFALLYLLSVAMVFGSRSATGVIVFLFLHFVTALILFWLKFHVHFKPRHYYAVVIALLIGFLIFITNTGFFFGFLGRTSDMTGRIPLWRDLLQRVYIQKPVFGYGYGALWMQRSFRVDLQQRHGWEYQVYFADNGFFDILLNTGLVGFLLFLGAYLSLGVRSIQRAIAAKQLLWFLPFLIFVYIFIGNLTYSFMLEIEQFTWLLLVTMLFVTSVPSSKIIAQP